MSNIRDDVCRSSVASYDKVPSIPRLRSGALHRDSIQPTGPFLPPSQPAFCKHPLVKLIGTGGLIVSDMAQLGWAGLEFIELFRLFLSNLTQVPRCSP